MVFHYDLNLDTQLGETTFRQDLELPFKDEKRGGEKWRILVLEDDRVQQGRIEQTLLDIGRSRNLRLEIDIAKNYGDVEKYSQYFDHYQSIYWI